MLFNFDIDGDALKPEHKNFLRREVIPKLRTGMGVAVIGLADRKGSAGHNQALSDKRVARTLEFLRAEVPAGFTLKQATGFGEQAAAREGEKDETLDERFRSVLIFLSAAPVVTQNKVIEVTAKSFIATIGPKIGSMPGFTTLPLTTIPVSRQSLLDLLAAATDAQFGENPRSAAKNKGYRLFSSCRFTVVFEDGKILAATPAIPELETDVGTEPPRGGLQPPDMIVSPVSVSAKGTNFVTFSWTGKGRPHLLAEPTFQTVRSRTSVFIWHTVTGRIDISSGSPVTTVSIKGSQFPSHRVFVDGVLILPEVPQGPFSNLWNSDPADSFKVK
jgi:hypothetical protein